MSRPPGLSFCFLKSSLISRISGFFAWRSSAKGDRVMWPSMSARISWTKAGSTQPAFWAMSIFGM